MNKDIPSHYYNESVDTIQRVHGDAMQSIDPQFPFAMTRFELINSMAVGPMPHRARILSANS